MHRLVIAVCLLAVSCLGSPGLGGRIIGGRTTEIKNYPYQLAFEHFGSLECGGAILNENWAVTAAHCLEDVVLEQSVFRAGTSFNGEGGTLHYAEVIIQHPQFDFDAHNFDIAVVKVKTPFTFGDDVQAIPLAIEEPVPGQIGTVTGWGMTDYTEELAHQLQVIDFPIVNRDECAQDFLEYKNQTVTITNNMVCAGYATGGTDTCKGDSGGPMAVDGKLAGVVSFGAGCAVPGFPAVFTNVAVLLDFIVNKTGVAL